MEERSSYRQGGGFLKLSSRKEKPFERDNLLRAYCVTGAFQVFDLANFIFITAHKAHLTKKLKLDTT